MCVYKLIKRVALMCVIVVVSSVTSVITVNIINQALYPNTPYPQKLNVSPRYNYESSTHCDNRPELESPTHCDIVSRYSPVYDTLTHAKLMKMYDTFFDEFNKVPPVICVVEKIKTEDAYVSDDKVYELK